MAGRLSVAQPNFASGGSISELVRHRLLHPECARIFRVSKGEDGPAAAQGQVIDLHQHQREAVEIARGGASYVLTTGTGSGKSLSYLVPIVDSVLREHAEGSYQPGVKAIIVYPSRHPHRYRAGQPGRVPAPAGRGC